VIIPDIGTKKLVEDSYLPPSLTIGPSSVDLTLSDSFSWPEPEKDKIVLGESVPHKHVQAEPLQVVLRWIQNLHKLIFVRRIYLIFGA
jgi:hypothetical protein